MRRRLLFLVLLGATGAAAPRPSAPSRWPPPLRDSRGVVAGFAEYRPDHLHPGIDFSTGGRTGLEVRAPEGGEIYRLKVEWRGYGRALYLRHPDGRISVYAHLERYDQENLGLESRVEEARRSRGTRYPGDIYLDPPVRVGRGARLGYSGESGAGLPHLHFEIRLSDQEPADPLPALDFSPAALPPVFGALSLTATDAEGWIEGERTGRFPLRRDADGTFVPAQPVRVSGGFRASAEIHSEDSEGHRLGIRALSVTIDSSPVYRLRLDEFRFSDYPQVGLLLDHARSRLSPARYDYFLERLPGNHLGAAGGEIPWPRLEEGSHVLEVVAEGALGGVSRARVPIQVVPRRELAGEPGGGSSPRWRFRLAPAKGSPGDGLGYWTFPDHQPLPCREPERLPDGETCRFDFPAGTTAMVAEAHRDGRLEARALIPVLSGSTEAAPDGVAMVSPGPGVVDLVIIPRARDPLPGRLVARDEAGGERRVGFLPEEGGRIRAGLPTAVWEKARDFWLEWRCPEGSCRTPLSLRPRVARPSEKMVLSTCPARLEIPVGGVFAETPVECRGGTPWSRPPAGLELMGDPAVLLPEGLPFARRAKLEFAIPPGEPHPERLALYRKDSSSGAWRYLGGERSAERLFVSLSRMETVALIRDDAPPRIQEIEPEDGGTVTGDRPLITIRVADEGTGLNFDGVTLEIDGKPIDLEYDPDRGWATGRPEQPLAPGIRHGRAWAADRAANRSPIVSFKFRVR